MTAYALLVALRYPWLLLHGRVFAEEGTIYLRSAWLGSMISALFAYGAVGGTYKLEERYVFASAVLIGLSLLLAATGGIGHFDEKLRRHACWRVSS